jgi:hypothetical protein
MVWSAIALVLYVMAAIRSKGILHWDEHFQILEFVNYKLGRMRQEDLPWEFRAKIRPWLQPSLYWCLISASRALGVAKPGAWALLCRLTSAMLGWLSLVAWARLYREWFPGRAARHLALGALVLAFYMPMLHARTSSENLSGSAMMLALALLAERTGISGSRSLCSLTTGRALGIGALLGSAFEFRYQVGFMVLGTMLWSTFHRRLSRRSSLLVLLGTVAVVAGGWGLDVWGYGTWRCLPPVAYADENIVKGVAASFGTSPWWSYIPMLCDFVGTPYAVSILVCFTVYFVTQTESLLTWSLLPYCALNVVVGHKEMRFLFPLLYFAPTIVALTVQGASERWGTLLRIAFGLSILAVLPGNTRELLRATTLPLETKFSAVERIFDAKSDERVHYVREDPMIYGEHEMRFYAPPAYQSERSASPSDLVRKLSKAGEPSLLWLEASDYDEVRRSLPPRCQSLIADREPKTAMGRAYYRLVGSQYQAREEHYLLDCAGAR